MTALAGQYHQHHSTPKVAITVTPPTASPSPTKHVGDRPERVRHVKFASSLSSSDLTLPEEAHAPQLGKLILSPLNKLLLLRYVMVDGVVFIF